MITRCASPSTARAARGTLTLRRWATAIFREVGRLRRRDIHDVYGKLDELVREVKKWTVLGSALKVITPDDLERHQRETDEWYAQAETSAGVADAEGESSPDSGVGLNGEAPHAQARRSD